MTLPPANRQHRWLRRLVTTACALVVLPPLLYLGVVNAFLNLGGIAKLFESTNTINASFASAWTVWPGLVNVSGVRVIFQDKNLQWSLDIPHAELRIALTELPSMSFHATSVRGEGAAFRFRHRVKPESKNLPSMQVVPTFPEYPGQPAVFEASVPEAPIPDAEYKLWTVHLEGVDLGVSELWMQQFRYRGTARARGAFRLKPARQLWVGPATLDIADGKLTVGEHLVTPELKGKIRCLVHPFDVRVPVGSEVFRFISTDIRLHGEKLDADFANLFVAPGTVLDFGSKRGMFDVDVRLARGMIERPSAIRVAEPEIAVKQGEWLAHADSLELLASAEPAGGGSVRLAVAQAKLTRALAQPSVFTAEDLRLIALTSAALDTTKSWPLTSAAVESTRARAKNQAWSAEARALKLESRERPTPSGVRRQLSGSSSGLELHGSDLNARGRGRADLDWTAFGEDADQLRGDVAFSDLFLERPSDGLVARAPRAKIHVQGEQHQRRLRGSLDLALPEVSARVGKMILLAGLSARSRSSDFDARLGIGRVHNEATLERVVIYEVNGDPKCPSSTLARATLTSDADFTTTGVRDLSLDALLESAKGRWGDFVVSTDVRVSAKLGSSHSEVPLGNLSLSLRTERTRLQSGSGSPNGWEAEVSGMTVNAALSAHTNGWTGPVQVLAPHARARIGGTWLTTDLDARVAVRSLDTSQGELTGAATVRVTHANLETGGMEARDWWAIVNVDAAHISAAQDLDLSATFRAHMRDAVPGLAVLVKGGDVPGWLATMLPLRELQTQGHVLRRCRFTDIGLNEIEGGPLVSSGRLQSAPNEMRGAFLVQLGALKPVSVGLSFSPDKTDVSPLVGDDWLTNALRTLDSHAAAVSRSVCEPSPPQCGF